MGRMARAGVAVEQAGEVPQHEEAGEQLVLPGKTAKGATTKVRQGEHDINEGEEAGAFHAHPGKAAGEVENGFGRGFAHAVPLDDPLKGAKLELSESEPVICSAWGDSRSGTTTART